MGSRWLDMGKVSPCYSTYERLMYSCAQVDWDSSALIIFPGDKKKILLFFGVALLALSVLAGGMWFSYRVWRKQKFAAMVDRRLRHERFLEKRRSLQMKKRVYDEIVSALEDQVSHHANSQELKDKLKYFTQERDKVEEMLSSTYSLPKRKTEQTGVLPLLEEMNDDSSVDNDRRRDSILFQTLSDSSSLDSDININTNPALLTTLSKSHINYPPENLAGPLSKTDRGPSSKMDQGSSESGSSPISMQAPQDYWRTSITQQHSSSSNGSVDDENEEGDDEFEEEDDADDGDNGTDTDNDYKAQNDEEKQQLSKKGSPIRIPRDTQKESSCCDHQGRLEMGSIFKNPLQLKFVNPLFGNSPTQANGEGQYQQRPQKKDREHLGLPRKRTITFDYKVNNIDSS